MSLKTPVTAQAGMKDGSMVSRLSWGLRAGVKWCADLGVVIGFKLVGVGLLGALACGVVTDAEMFSQSNAALVENSGEACDLVSVGEAETVVDENHPHCGPGYCLGKGGEEWTRDNHGICTCRCDGPEGTGPLCDCADGYQCKEMFKDFGLNGLHLVGSYCVPRE